jgi:hypothetical protein
MLLILSVLIPNMKTYLGRFIRPARPQPE